MTITDAERLIAEHDEYGSLHGSSEEDLVEAYAVLQQRIQDNEEISREREP